MKSEFQICREGNTAMHRARKVRGSVCEDDVSLQEMVDKLLRTLPPRDRRALTLRFGLDGKPPRSLDECGAYLGHVTRERVRQIEQRAIRNLRHPSRARYAPELKCDQETQWSKTVDIIKGQDAPTIMVSERQAQILFIILSYGRWIERKKLPCSVAVINGLDKKGLVCRHIKGNCQGWETRYKITELGLEALRFAARPEHHLAALTRTALSLDFDPILFFRVLEDGRAGVV